MLMVRLVILEKRLTPWTHFIVWCRSESRVGFNHWDFQDLMTQDKAKPKQKEQQKSHQSTELIKIETVY